MSAEEINEGEVIIPRTRRKIEKDATKWKILETGGEGNDAYVVFQAGTYTNTQGIEIPVIFKCHKTGIIYREWEKEAKRRMAGGDVPQEREPEPYIDIEPASAIFQRVPEPEEKLPMVVQLIDSQLEERQYRLSKLRDKLKILDGSDSEAEEIRKEIRRLEKKILGDPVDE